MHSDTGREKKEELSGGLVCAIVLGGKCGKWEEANSWTIEVAISEFFFEF